MKTLLKILIYIDLCFYIVSIAMYLLGSVHYGIAAGLGILFLSFVVSPIFLAHEYMKARRRVKEEEKKTK